MAKIGKVDKNETECNIQWKITNFFSLTNTFYYSPKISFAKEQWRLHLYPNRRIWDKSHTNRYVSVFLKRYSFGPPMRIAFSFSLQTLEGEKVSVASTECVFTIYNDSFGFSKFVLRSEVVNKKSELVPSNTLTIVCSMKCLELTKDTNLTGEMTEEVRDDKIIMRQLPTSAVSSAVYTLEMPNVFTLAEYDNTTYKLYSPTFEIKNSIWRFLIKPSSVKEHKEFGVLIERLNFKFDLIKLQGVFYQIELLKGTDELYDVDAGERNFKGVGDKRDYLHRYLQWGQASLQAFKNNDPSHDKRDVLILTVHLIYVDSTDMEEDQIVTRNLTSEMTEEVRDDKIIIRQLPKRAISSIVYILKVPNVFTLAEYDGSTFEFYSPAFEFVNSTWRFHIKSHPVESNKNIFILLQRMYFKKLKQQIIYECELLDGRDQLNLIPPVVHFVGNKDEHIIKTFWKEICHHNNVLTFIVHLIYVESTEMEADQVLMRSGENALSTDEEDDGTEISSSKIKGMEILSENLKQMLLDGRMCDAVLKVDGKDFNVHKFIMAARSPVFASMFQHDLGESNTNEVDIPDCTAESFEVFVHYFYTSSVQMLSTSNVYNVYYAADKYQVDDLKKRCVQFMKRNISVDTFCDVIDLSLRHGESELQKTATDFFCENVKDIIKTVQWLKYLEANTVQANELFIKFHNAYHRC